MTGKADIVNHPIHPRLIQFPAGSCTSSLAPGFSRMKNPEFRKAGIQHAIVTAAVFILVSVNCFTRSINHPAIGTALALSLISVGFIPVAGRQRLSVHRSRCFEQKKNSHYFRCSPFV